MTNPLLKIRDMHNNWIEKMANKSPAYSFNLFIIQLSVTALIMVPFLSIIAVASGVHDGNFELFTMNYLYTIIAITLFASVMFWIGQSEYLKDAENSKTYFDSLCNSPKSIKSFKLADRPDRVTVLSIEFLDGTTVNLFEGIEAVNAHKRLNEIS